MWLLRGLGASLLWILAGLLGLVGALLCVTIILLPVGIPLIMMARRLFSYSMVVLVPSKVRHPVKTTKKSTKKSAKRSAKSAKKSAKSAKKSARDRIKHTVGA
jgi:hypothetical protein